MDQPFDINKKRPGPWDKDVQVGDREVTPKKIKCKGCKKDHSGTMVFYPDLCLTCVLDMHCKGEVVYLTRP